MGNFYPQILRSSSIIGGAAVINIIVGLLRMKVAAVVLGPAGVGLIGLLQSLMGTASAIAGLGLGNSGTRQIAEAAGREDTQAQAITRRAMSWATFLLAIVGGALFWALRDVLAAEVLFDPTLAGTVGWLALGVALTVAAGSQGASLNGLRRLGDLARVSIWSAALSTILGVMALLAWGERGLLAFVLAGPFASFVVGQWYVTRLPPIGNALIPHGAIAEQWKALVRLGMAFMVSGVAVALGNLAVRTLVQRTLGVDALGHYQAAWLISMTYIGFVLAAMSTDFYPHLTATMHDHPEVNRLVNQQTEVALLLTGPVFLAMIGLAPWIIELLYSSKFDDAVLVLRWQVLGDVLKVASWPLGFVILAAGDGRTFMMVEILAIVIFVGLTWMSLPLIGIQATGVAFLAMYLLLLPVVYWLAWRRTGFKWQRSVGEQFVILLALSIAVFLVATWSKWSGMGLGLLASAALGLSGLARLQHMVEVGGLLGRLAGLSQQLLKKARLSGNEEL